MDFAPSHDEALVAATARAFAERELAPRAAARDRDEAFPEAELRALGGLGLLGVTVPEALGGGGAGSVALAHAIAELARADASVAVTVAVTNMVADVLARWAPEDLRARVLPRLCAGELSAGAFALSEPGAGSDPTSMRTTAVAVDGGYRLNGGKLWITSGDRAGIVVVVARHAGRDTEARRFSAFAIERGAPGLSSGRHERKMGQRGSTTVALTLDDVYVPSAHRLGQEGDGLKIALGALDGGRVNVAALAVGVGRAALEAALAYARERRQFDRPIAEFQAVQCSLADAAISLDAAWLLTTAAAHAKDLGRPATRLAAEAKLFASERAVEVCDRAIQIHGGYGYARELPVERYFRDVRVTTIYEGTSQIQKLVIARQLLREMEETRRV